MIARIVSIGDELLCGRTVDTNASATQRRLLAHGVAVTGVHVVPDRAADIASALDAAPRGSLVVLTGGLGPTPDDLSVAAVADWAELPLEADAGVEAALRAWALARGVPFRANLADQALRPAGFRALVNPAGTAPALVGEARGRTCVLLPGPPAEVAALWPAVEAELVARGLLAAAHDRQLRRTCGLPEPEVARRTTPLRDRWPDALWSWWLTRWGVDVQVAAVGAGALPAELGPALDAALGTHVYADSLTDLNAVAVAALRESGRTLATAESCTGGLIGAAVTDVPGASAVYLGGVQSYADAAKRDLLGVPPALLAAHGAVSGPVAAAMAAGARDRLGADYALAVTGIAGPDGGSEEKPVGTTWIALAAPDAVWTGCHRFRSFRERNRELAVSHALDALRRHLGGGGDPWAAPPA